MVSTYVSTYALQDRAAKWVRSRLGGDHMSSNERAMRLLEEAIELAQAHGIAADLVHNLTEHVYSRPAGIQIQEAGGVAVCLLAWCTSVGYGFGHVVEMELNRIESKTIEQIRESLARKSDEGLVIADSEAGQ